MPRKKVETVDAGSGDVLVDLGFADAEERKVRVQLAMQVNELIAARRLTQARVAELLGIPQRPSNLRIIGDWMRPGGDNAIAAGGGAQMVMNQMRQDQERARQQLNRAYQRALARALKESTNVSKVEIPKATKLSDWNRLVSKLGDDLRQGRGPYVFTCKMKQLKIVQFCFNVLKGLIRERAL